MGILQQIDINDLPPEKYININDFSQEYIEWINDSQLLLKKAKRLNSEGTFDSTLWIILDEVSKTHLYLYFEVLQSMVLNGTLTNNDIIIIKCWLVDSMREDISTETLNRMFSSVVNIIESTNNFDLETLDGKKGDAIATLLTKTPSTYNISYYVSEYIYFLEDIDLANKGHLFTLDRLQSARTQIKSEMRVLPESKDILAFQYYLKKFYIEESNEHLLNFYKPVLLWWKLTNVIPMRPSEFSYKLKRDCLTTENGECFLNIDRVKVTNSNPQRTEARIPLLRKLKITKEIHDLISDYILATAFDTDTKTLISYKATLKFRNDYFNENNQSENNVNLRYNTQEKMYNDTFTREDLSNLISSFYDLVIEGKYKDFSIKKRLKPGDTRHLAFTSLLLQGIAPIEIAMLGGHTTLEAQSSYTGHVEYYIDSEILNFIGNKNINPSVIGKKLKEIIMNKSWTCPKFIANCSPTDDGIGYCTIDMLAGTELCDDVECCIYCKKWWCEPTNENYIKAKNFIEHSSLGPLKQTIKEEEQFLFRLLSEANIINVEGLLELDKNDDEAVKQSILKLRSSADKIIFFKKSLLETFSSEAKKIK